MLTSSAQSDDVARAYEAGANCYLSKPLDTNRLLQIVADMTRFWLRDCQLPPKV